MVVAGSQGRLPDVGDPSQARSGWIEAASCKGVVPNSEFYEMPTSARAIACCYSCPVRLECGEDEFAHVTTLDEVVGYRAGMTAEERRCLAQAERTTSASAERQDRVAKIRWRLAAGALVSEVAEAEGVDRRTIARWLLSGDSHRMVRAG